MVPSKIVLFLLMFVFINKSVKSQVCVKRNIVTRWVPQSYTYTYIQTYTRRCYWSRTCKYSMLKVGVDVKQVPRSEEQIINVCCDGYIRADNYSDSDGNPINCTPVCMPACRNGVCTRPGHCECNEGYLLDPTNTRNCYPFCPNNCGHGTCVEPRKCECNFGYSLQNGTCEPICTEACINGKCVAPDSCECLPGYRKSESNACEPYCSKGCVHGTCVGPEICNCSLGYVELDDGCVPRCEDGCGNGTCVEPNICECYPGYVLLNGTCEPFCSEPCTNGECVAPNTCECNSGYSPRNGTCEPVCNETCTNGICVAPDTCDCLPGYRKTENESCTPHCDKCVNGTCTGPEICLCNDGYTMRTEGECVPTCSIPCGNGTCIETNVCQCFPGYKINEAMETDKPLCMPKCRNCEGVCVAPDECICDAPYRTVHLNAEGQVCECFDDCSESSSKCERTVCNLDITERKSLAGDELEANEPTDRYNDSDISASTDSFGLETNITNDIDDYKDEVLSNRTDKYKNDTVLKEGVLSYPYWIYAVIAIVIVLLFILLTLFIKRKSLSKHFNGGSYVVEDHKTKESNPAQTNSMRLSSLVESRQDRC